MAVPFYVLRSTFYVAFRFYALRSRNTVFTIPFLSLFSANINPLLTQDFTYVRFLRAAATSAVCGLGTRTAARAASPPEVLYNGITLGSPWPPRLKYPDERAVVPPYLASPPAVIPIDVGRQLLVDDFLIEDTTMTRAGHRPTLNHTQ